MRISEQFHMTSRQYPRRGNVAEPNPPAVNGSTNLSRACQQKKSINKGFQRRETMGTYTDMLLDQERVGDSIWSFHVKQVLS